MRTKKQKSCVDEIVCFRCFCIGYRQPVLAAEPANLQKQFHDTVQPYVAKYCVGCHGGASPAAQFDIKSYDSLAKVTGGVSPLGAGGRTPARREMPPKPVRSCRRRIRRIK